MDSSTPESSDRKNEKDSEPDVYHAEPRECRRSIVVKRPSTSVSRLNQIPIELLEHHELNQLIQHGLPTNYNFEIHKTIWRIKCNGANRILLQFPEGLIRFGPIIVDIIENYFNITDCIHKIQCITMGDLTYGACCIDDYLASSMGCDLVVHYAHSCLVPIDQLKDDVKFLYVFVDIKFDLDHLEKCIEQNFAPDDCHIALASTIQFVSSVHELSKRLKSKMYSITLPQSRPLTSGEVLGCTAPKLSQDITCIIFVCDGRFHLEALMIANPTVKAFRYDPYTRKLTRESYKFDLMLAQRKNAILQATRVMQESGTFGLILGTLGRQGNERVYDMITDQLKNNTNCKYVQVLLPEVTQDILQSFKGIDAWVQVACPRLSIDWGDFFETPLLNPYEFSQSLAYYMRQKVNIASLKSVESKSKLDLSDLSDMNSYPMDYYAKASTGPWTPNHSCTGNAVCSCSSEQNEFRKAKSKYHHDYVAEEEESAICDH
ncbi:2-(3-amino-3-carboxypropyl)histidine synthase subunit 1, partial [Fragariocoptes setiger]